MPVDEQMYADRGDVEQAKKQFLARWTHRGCGGVPVAYVERGQIGCSRCKQVWDGAGTLGSAIARIKEFARLEAQ